MIALKNEDIRAVGFFIAINPAIEAKAQTESPARISQNPGIDLVVEVEATALRNKEKGIEHFNKSARVRNMARLVVVFQFKSR